MALRILILAFTAAMSAEFATAQQADDRQLPSPNDEALSASEPEGSIDTALNNPNTAPLDGTPVSSNSTSQNQAEGGITSTPLPTPRNLALDEEAPFPPLEQENIEITPSPLNTYQYILIFIGVAGFLFSVFNFLFTLWLRRSDRSNSIIDNFWLREILIPKSLEPMDDLLLNSKFRFLDYASLSEQELDNFIKSIDQLRHKLSIATLISSELMLLLEESLDELCITIAQKSAPEDLYNPDESHTDGNSGDPFLQCYKSMLRHLMDAHHGIKVTSVLAS